VEPSASAVGPHALEDQASASAQSAPTALLHPLKAAVLLPLSRSMQLAALAVIPPTRSALLLSCMRASLAELMRQTLATDEHQARRGGLL
jgi:hypothetical protein